MLDQNQLTINRELMNFINQTPNAYVCVENIKTELIKAGFRELLESQSWELAKGEKYFVIRNDASIIAFDIGDLANHESFNIVSVHGDSPSFSIKPNSEMIENGYLKLNTDRYGGMIYYSWLDRPLSLSGRVIVKKDRSFLKKIINIDKDLFVIPSQAIHLNRDINENGGFNPQVDLLPIMALADKTGDLATLLQEQVKEGKVCDYDLFLYNRDQARYCGGNDDFILAPRLDDLGCAYPALKGLIQQKSRSHVTMFCCFNHEEVGSLSEEGADSTFLSDMINRICGALNWDIYRAISNSMLVSADNGHAIHPNAAAKSDVTNKVFLNKGVVIKHHINYTTNGLSASIFKDICEKAEVPHQDFACRSDLRCGSTLGGISLSHVSIPSIDIGLPQLAMHSANELIGSKDVYSMYNALLAFYKTDM